MYIRCYSNTMSEEKRRIENRLSTMEEELEEEQSNNETTLDKARKALQQVDTLSSEVSSLQSSLNQSESAKSSLEKQVITSYYVVSYV